MSKTDQLIQQAEYGSLIAKLHQIRPPKNDRCPIYFVWNEKDRCLLQRGHTGEHKRRNLDETPTRPDA